MRLPAWMLMRAVSVPGTEVTVRTVPVASMMPVNMW